MTMTSDDEGYFADGEWGRGYNSDAPNGNVEWRVVDNGDGTGTRTTYDRAGNTLSTEQVVDLPVPAVPEEPSLPLAAEVAAARASLNTATTVAQTKARALALDELRGQQLEALITPT